ncbi:MAG: hypothetical protein JRJ87_02785 [Deltaproteobacteria bacterium]|nr:hypothetical protein [Deltaproteobacteria bacterium]
MRKSAIIVSWLTVLVIIQTSQLQASGYHPPFDQAVSEAQLVVLGEVTKAWCPGVKKAKPAGQTACRAGRVFRMKIEKVYKGNLKPGAEIVFVDPHHGSTASYRVAEGKPNLTFLIPAEFDEFTKRRYEFGAGMLYRPIRNLSRHSIFGEDNYSGWLFLLEQVVPKKPGDLHASLTRILEQNKNRHVLRYAIEHFPASFTESDQALFKKVILENKEDAFIISPVVRRLVKQGVGFAPQVLRELITKCSPYARQEFFKMIDRENISALQDKLFEFLKQKKPADEQKLIDILARFAPEYLKDQLSRQDLPFWKLIPCLQALKIDGRAVGRSGFSAEIIRVSPYTLRQLGEVLNGDEFYGILAMAAPLKNSDWEVLFPLLEPTLAGADTPIRKMIVALMRTFGRQVSRLKKTYHLAQTDQRSPKPIALEILTGKRKFRLDEPVSITIKEIAQLDRAWISLEGELGWAFDRPDKTWVSSGGSFHVFKNAGVALEKHHRLKKGEVVQTSQVMTSFFDVPGVYQVKARKLYPHDGGAHGLDSWTGVVFSEPIEIEIYE